MNPTHNLRWYFVYLLKLQRDQSLYVGCTDDLKQRIYQHNHARSYHTRKYTPWKLLYFEGYSNVDDAYRREQSLKLHAQGLRRLKERLRRTLA